MYLPNNKELKNISQNLRKNQTKEEKHLWYDFLREYPIQFNRQKVIGNYIADFYCKRANLIIELDGSQHYENANRQFDNKRTEYFNNLGLSVLRFSNLDIKMRFKEVCLMIDKEVNERL